MSTVTSYKSVMRLTISKMQEQDYGDYKCIARNPRGDADGDIKIYGKWIVRVVSAKRRCRVDARKRFRELVNSPRLSQLPVVDCWGW